MIEPEEKSRGDIGLVRLIWPYVARERGLYVIALVLLPMTIVLPLFLPRIVKEIIDVRLPLGLGAPLLGSVGALLLIVVAHFIVTTIFQTLLRKIGLKIVANLRRDLFSRMLEFPVSFFRNEPKGKIVARLTTDLDQIDDMFATGGILLVADFFSVIAIGAAMIFLSPRLGLWGLAVIPIMAVVITILSDKMRAIVRVIRAQTAKMNAFAQEALSAHDVVAVLGARKKFAGDFDVLSGEFEKFTLRANRYEAAFFAGIDFFGSIAIGVLLWAAVGADVTAGLLIAMTQYIQQFFVPLRGLATRFATFQQAMVALERVEHFLQLPTEKIEGRTPHPSSWTLRIENLSFAYRPDKPVLGGAKIEIESDKHVALIGETGGGKSTLARILLGFYRDYAGRITIGGEPIEEWNLRERRKIVTLVPQEVFLFDASMEENITLGREIDPERLSKIIASVGLEDVRERKASTLGEWGRRLSEGEKQLIAAARVIAYDPRIVILDEATSALDPLLDVKVRRAIRKALEGRSAVIIAHRLSTLESADRIAVMHKGKIEEEGVHAELMARGGTYAKLHRLLELHESEKAAI